MNSSKKESKKNPNCVPIVLGITGHRDIVKKDEEELRKSIRNIFQDFLRLYPNSPIKVLSSLAEGADRIAADEALKCGMALLVPLPLPIEEYEKDFTTDASLNEFRTLLSRCEKYINVFELECETNEKNSSQLERAYCYRNAGIYVAKHCHALIAFWDGDSSHKVGGTSEIVKFKLEGINSFNNKNDYKSIESFLISPDRGPVYHIITPRASNISPVGKDFSLKKLYFDKPADDSESDKMAKQVLINIDRYNKDINKFSKKLSKKLETSKKYVIDEASMEKLTTFQKRILNAFSFADQLSIYYRGLRFALLKLLMFIGLSLVVLFLLYDELESNIMLPTYIIIFAIASFLYYFANKIDLQNKYVDYRALAEGLKIQFYWNFAGMPLNTSEYYILGQMDDMTWIRQAINGYFCGSIFTENNTATDNSLGIISSSWIKEQNRYFKKSSTNKKRRLHKQEKTINILFIVSIVLILSATVLEFGTHNFMGRVIPVSTQVESHILMHTKVIDKAVDTEKVHKPVEYQELFVRSIFKILLALIVALIAFISNYNNKLALSEQVKNYRKMANLFDIASERMDEALRCDNYLMARKILFELGREALTENAGWVLLHRERPLEMPK